MGKAFQDREKRIKEIAQEKFAFIKPVCKERKSAEEIFASVVKSIQIVSQISDSVKEVIKDDAFKFVQGNTIQSKEELSNSLAYLLKQFEKVQEELRGIDIHLNARAYCPQGGQGAIVRVK